MQIVGSAYIDDFANYTLDVGPGDNPDAWTTITDQRPQAVDKALLGVWNTTGLQPGRYRLRIRVFDSFQNTQESAPILVTLSAAPTPTPPPTAVPTPVPATATRAPTVLASTPQPTPPPGTPQPTRPPTPRPTPRP